MLHNATGKKEYVRPALTLLELSTQDVLTASAHLDVLNVKDKTWASGITITGVGD